MESGPDALPSKRKRNLSISTVLILALAAFAGVAYYIGTPPSLPSGNMTSDACSPLGAQIVIPEGVGTNSSIRFEPPTLHVVVGVNNTIVWSDQDTTAPHNIISVSVPPNGVQWYFDQMTAGNTYCVTLTAPGTYTYELYLNYVVEGKIIVSIPS
jgi:plastocyanin